MSTWLSFQAKAPRCAKAQSQVTIISKALAPLRSFAPLRETNYSFRKLFAGFTMAALMA